MTKEMAKDIAIALIAKSGDNFDAFAFDDSDISEKDIDKILLAIHGLCEKMISKIESKYNIALPNTTSTIIDAIVFE
jgi:hypothetical protein